MFFIVLTFFAALFIEGLGSLVSVIGISALFGANPIIIALAISLDVGKIVVVSLLYTYWKRLSKLMKSYALLAATVTMVITSAGAAGYLSGAFQQAIMGTKEGELKVSVLKEQQAKYQERKKQIDDQIAKLPEKTTVNQRLRLMNGFKAEQKTLDDKITAIDKELPDAQIKQIGVEAKAGPILYIAKAFNITVEEAVKYVIGMIIFVFDPLAIFLIIAGNFLWAQRKKERLEAAPAKVKWAWPPGARVNVPMDPPEPDLKVNMGRDAYDMNNYGPMEDVTPASSAPIYEELQPTPYISPRQEYFEDVQRQEEIAPGPAVGVEFPNEEPKPVSVPPSPKPINVDLDVHRGMDNMLEIKPLSFGTGPKPIPLGKQLPVNEPVQPREEITRSTLGLIDADPSTIVDAHRAEGFQRARAVTSPKK